MNAPLPADDIRAAAAALRRGGILLYPTDTVWGLGCRADDDAAVRALFSLKERADGHAMLSLVSSRDMLQRYVEVTPAVTALLDNALRPVTVVYPAARALSPLLLGDDGSAALRLTADPWCRAVIERLGVPLVSTSANISGEPPAATFADITPRLRDAVSYTARWRRDDIRAARPSTLVRLLDDGTLHTLRP